MVKSTVALTATQLGLVPKSVSLHPSFLPISSPLTSNSRQGQAWLTSPHWLLLCWVL